MLSLLHASMLHASPAEPGLRPVRPHGKARTTWRALTVRGMLDREFNAHGVFGNPSRLQHASLKTATELLQS